MPGPDERKLVRPGFVQRRIACFYPTKPAPAFACATTSRKENTMNNLLDVLTREGVLINVSVRYWRGCKKLRPEDLGLAADDVSNRLISLGHKRLLPKEATADLTLI